MTIREAARSLRRRLAGALRERLRYRPATPPAGTRPSLYVAHYNLCRVHEALRTTPAVALGITDRSWTIGDLLDAALSKVQVGPETTAPQRRRRFRAIEGGRS